MLKTLLRDQNPRLLDHRYVAKSREEKIITQTNVKNDDSLFQVLFLCRKLFVYPIKEYESKT